MENELKEPALKYNYITAEEYLEIDRSSKGKYELHRGTMITMQGASLNHNRIVSNLIINAGSYLKGKSCSVFPSDLRTKLKTSDSFVYPDITIVCGEPELMDDHFDTLLNPSVIIEVLSPSTEKYDKGFKFMFYVLIPSVKEYIMIDSTKLYAHISRRQNDDSWKFEEIINPASSVSINTIDYSISLDDIYADVKF
ncbi:MAG: Uma2 family endonuclease [Ginsengibacter sp.]